MRLGLMSDIHGNAVALRAVLDDAATLGIDRWWLLGDLVALGPDPVAVLDILDALPNAECIAGNTERYVLTGERPYPGLDDVTSDPTLLPRLIEVAASFAWTRGALTHAGWYDWLASLPSSLRHTLPDGTRILGIHASPRSDDGPGIDTRIRDDALADLLEGCDADIVLGGHTHDATDRIVGGVRAVNLGSVSNAHRADRRASYVVIEAGPTSHSLVHRCVDYDHDAVIRRLDEVHHPAAGYIAQFQRPS